MSLPSAAARRELARPAPVGQRHAQIVRLACRLRADGFSPPEIFSRLRANYDPATLPDREISAVLRWAENKITPGIGRVFAPGKNYPQKLVRQQKTGFLVRSQNLICGKTPEAGDFLPAINKFLSGFSCGEMDLFDASPVKLPGDFRKDAELTLQSLYFPSEKLNLVTRFRESRKICPVGFGKTLSRNEWLNGFRNKPFPESEAGAWFRISPVNGKGIADADVSKFRFALLESDFLPVETQLSLFAKLPVPICAIVKSGGKSVHAWIRIAAHHAGEYRERVGTLFSLLSPFGFDAANKNPSRLSRLPGAQRVIGATGDGKQRLLYLNPDATERSIA